MTPMLQSTAREENPRPPAAAPRASTQGITTGTIEFPLSAKKWVKLELPYQLSEEEWTRIIKTLDVFKPGFMAESEEEDA